MGVVAEDARGPAVTSRRAYALDRASRRAFAGGSPLGSSAPAWSPSDLGADVIAWWDFSDFSRLYQDSGRTTLVTAAGQTVGSVTDRSASGIHLTQPTASKEPAVVAVGSLYGLSFDGVDDWMYASSTHTIGDHTIVQRIKFDAANGYAWYYSAANVRYSYRPTSATYYVSRGAGYGFSSAAAWASLGTMADYAWTSKTSSPYGEMFRDDVSKGTITSNPGSGSYAMTFCLCADNAGSNRATATACEVIVINRALSASELTQIHDYLDAKWV